MADAHDKASDVAADHGLVIVDGPGGIIVTFTPEAALQTAERLIAAATKAEEYYATAVTEGETDGLGGN